MLPELPPETQTDSRLRLLRAVRRHFAKNRRPRLVMGGVLLLTGVAGLLTSFLLLKLGFVRMWLRYPTAVFVAWAVFLALLRGWAGWERATFQFDEKALAESSPDDLPDNPESLRSIKGSWSDGLDLSDIGNIFEFGEGCLPTLAVILLLGVLFLTIGAISSIITAAPYLISEVFLDAALVTALYRRMRRIDQRSWLESAVSHTFFPTLWTALLLFGIGVGFHLAAPEAKSIRGVWHHFVEGRSPAEVEGGR